jgi:DUF1680 family protein
VLEVTLADEFWAPRLVQLRDKTLPTIAEQLEVQGVFDNFRRLAGSAEAASTPRRAMHFSDSDLYKWVEAAILAGEEDRCQEAIALIAAVQQPDGYVGTFYGFDAHPPPFSDLAFGHEQYCIGHLVEAAVTQTEVTGSDELLDVAVRAADGLIARFGPGLDERTDGHPEIELALCRLTGVTGEARYVSYAAWAIEQQLAAAGMTLGSFRLGGHAVRAIYFVSGMAEVALATGEDRWVDAAIRGFDALVDFHSYPTGAVGSRWLGEALGRPFEQPDASAYAESCAAVAAAQLAERMWRLTAEPRALDHLELLLYNAVPCGVGADGAAWFYSQPQAVDEVAADTNLWCHEFDYGQVMLRDWFPARRHRWFAVPCCPPNLARMFAAVPRCVAEIDGHNLLVHLPIASRIRGQGWDVTITGRYPDDGRVAFSVHAAPDGGQLLVRQPGWTEGRGHTPPAAGGTIDLPVDWTWWTTDHRVEGGTTAHLRRGPIVYCLEGVDHPGIDLRDLAVDPTCPPETAFYRRQPGTALHRPWAEPGTSNIAVAAVPRPYASWANRGPTTMRLRFPVK